MSATLDGVARNMRESLKPQAARLLTEVRALQPKVIGVLTATAPRPKTLFRRPLRCRLGLHRWETRTSAPYDFIVFEWCCCASCGKRARS